MKEYHLIWLSAHPERGQGWLCARLLDGFDIHHVDGDHENNVAENLILIEHRDHFMLHSAGRPSATLRLDNRGPTKKTLRRGRVGYELRKQGYSWSAAAAFLTNIEGADCGHRGLMAATKVFTATNNLPWPIPVTKVA